MSCIDCDKAQLLDEDELELVFYTYVRVGRANVLISGCKEHLRELLTKLAPKPQQDILPKVNKTPDNVDISDGDVNEIPKEEK